MGPFECPGCKKTYLSKQSLKYHIQTFHQGQPKKRRPCQSNKSEYPHQCPFAECPRGYGSLTRLQNHLVLSHSAPAPLKVTHLKRSRDKTTMPYPCPYQGCPHAYFFEKRLTGHLLLFHSHEEIPPSSPTSESEPVMPVETAEEALVWDEPFPGDLFI